MTEVKSKPKILIVEDETIIARDIDLMLKRLGYEVPGIAASGKDAIMLCDTDKPDLVLMDIVLKGDMDGIETADVIRTQFQIPVVYSTSYADNGTIERARMTGPYGYIIKPFKEKDLHSTIEMALYKHSLEKEKQALQEQLLHAQKMEAIGTLAGGVAHDFNNLLTVIQGYSDLVLNVIPEKDPLYNDIMQIYNAALSAARLTNQLLLFSRKQPMEFKCLDLNGIIQNLIRMLRRIIGEEIKIHIDLNTEPVFVNADQGCMEQVLMNLAVNAKDAMPTGGRLTIKTEIKDSADLKNKPSNIEVNGCYVSCSVRDTGTGMDEKTLKRIFDPFFTTKKAGKGTGLGLSVVYGTIEQHEGWVEVQSQPGKGTVFSIFLQMAAKKKVEEKKNVREIQKLNGHHERILLVEDELWVREFIRHILRKNDYEVFDAGNAMEAIDLFEQEKNKFDALITDLVLPDIHGLRMVSTLLKKKPDLHVLLTSGYTNGKLNWDKIKEKKYAFIQKPFNGSDLLIKLKMLLNDGAVKN